jgi:hypothetical protein
MGKLTLKMEAITDPTHDIHSGSGAHTAFYTMPGAASPRARLKEPLVPMLRTMNLYLHSPIRLHAAVLN